MIGDKIRKIDIFKKVPRDISEGTNVGGCVSILTAVVIVALVAVQVSKYINPELKTTLSTNKQGITRK